MVFSTYVGGSAIDALQAIVTANDGTLWISGVTFSANWPIASPLQSSFAGQSDGVLVHLSSSGQLLMSSFVGDGNCQGAHALALAPDGAIYMGGSFAFVQVVFGREECVSTSIGWLVKVAPGGGSIAWERLVDGTDDVGGLVAPGADSIWAVGRTTSTGMPTGPDAYERRAELTEPATARPTDF